MTYEILSTPLSCCCCCPQSQYNSNVKKLLTVSLKVDDLTSALYTLWTSSHLFFLTVEAKQKPCWSSLSSSRRWIKIVISLNRLGDNIFLHLFVLVEWGNVEVVMYICKVSVRHIITWSRSVSLTSGWNLFGKCLREGLKLLIYINIYIYYFLITVGYYRRSRRAGLTQPAT